MEHRLFRVVTRIGAAFVEDQVMFLESEDRGHEEELWGGGGMEGALGGGRMPVYTCHTFTSSRALLTLYQAEFCPSGSLTDAGSGTISQGSHKNYKTTQPTLLP